MRKRKNIIILLIGFFILWGLDICLIVKIENQCAAIEVVYDKDVLEQRKVVLSIQQYFEQKNVMTDYAIYKDIGAENLFSELQNKQVSVQVTESFGSADMIVTDRFVDGQMFSQNTEDECIIDKGTAFKLFGTTKASGCQIIYNSKQLTIAGVVDTLEPFMLINNCNSNSSFNCLSIRLQNKNKVIEWENINEEQIVEGFVSQYGFGTPALVLNSKKIYHILNFGVRLPSYIILLWLICILWGRISTKIRRMYRIYERTSIIKKQKFLKKMCIITAGLVIGSLIYVWLYVKLTGVTFHFPEELIPGKWSDFSFYRNLLNEYKATIEIYFNRKLVLKALFIKKYSAFIVITSVLILVILWGLYVIRKYQEKKDLINTKLELIGVIGISYLCGFILFRTLGFTFPLYYHVCLCFCVDWLAVVNNKVPKNE